MADLFNQQISATYSGLLKTSSSGVLSASLSQISDGRGNTSPLYLSTGSIQFYGAYSFPNADGSANQVLKTDGAGVLTWEDDANSGTVTSVALSVPTGLTVTGSPITTSGTITIGGTLGVANGGTGATTLTGILVGNGTSVISVVTDGTVGKVLSTNANGTYSFIDAATGDVSISGTPVANQIAIWTDATTIKGDATFTIDANHKITLYQPNSVPTDLSNYNIGGGNIATVTGLNNTGFGKDNLNALTSGFSNVAIGYESSENLTVGFRNVSVGYQSLFSAQGATDNTAVGEGALYANISGEENVAIGAYALRLTIDGYNTAVGQGAGSNNQQGEFNTYVGRSSGSGNASSDNNVAIGSSALTFFTGGNNTSIGMQSLLGVTNQSTGTGNTALGYNSGSAITTGSKNVIIGSFTGFRAAVVGGLPEYSIIASSNNIVLSDGDGNVRQSFDSNGDATFSSSVTTTQLISLSASGSAALFLKDASANNKWEIGHSTNNLYFYNYTRSGNDLILNGSTGDATFSSNVNASTFSVSGAIPSSAASKGYFDYSGGGARFFSVGTSGSTKGSFTFIAKDADDGSTTPLTISSGGDATFSSSADASVQIGNPSSGDLNAYLKLKANGGANAYVNSIGAGSLILGANGEASNHLSISSGGNVGIGITPSPQNLITGSLDLNGGAGIFGYDKRAYLASNVYYQAPSGWKVKEAGYGAFMLVGLTNGDFGFYTTTQGATDNATVTDSRSLHITQSGVLEKNGDSSKARIIPETDNVGYLGESSHRWQAVYAVNGSIQTSDRNQKTLITTSDLGLDFILKLQPVSYKWKVGGYDIKENGGEKEPTRTPIEGKRNHYGLIAQQVKEVVGDKDFGGWVKEDLEDDASMESLRYAEFISPMIKAIQEQQTIIEDLKSRIETLEG